MNKLCALIILASASCAFAAEERYQAEEKPQEFADQEGCYLKEANKVFPYDTRVSADDGSCSQYLCSKDTGETQKFTCGAVAINDGCKAVQDLTQQYPDCCIKEQCDATTPAPTTTTAAPSTPAPTTTAASSAPSTTPASSAPSTTPSPAAAPVPPPGTSYAYASAKSESGKPPVTQTYATPGATASASAT